MTPQEIAQALRGLGALHQRRIFLRLRVEELPGELLDAPPNVGPSLPHGQARDLRVGLPDGSCLHFHLHTAPEGEVVAVVHLDDVDPRAGLAAGLRHLHADTLITRLAVLLALPGLAFGLGGALAGAALGAALGSVWTPRAELARKEEE